MWTHFKSLLLLLLVVVGGTVGPWIICKKISTVEKKEKTHLGVELHQRLKPQHFFCLSVIFLSSSLNEVVALLLTTCHCIVVVETGGCSGWSTVMVVLVTTACCHGSSSVQLWLMVNINLVEHLIIKYLPGTSWAPLIIVVVVVWWLVLVFMSKWHLSYHLGLLCQWQCCSLARVWHGKCWVVRKECWLYNLHVIWPNGLCAT